MMDNDLFDIPDFEQIEDESFPPLPPPFSPGNAGEGDPFDNGESVYRCRSVMPASVRQDWSGKHDGYTFYVVGYCLVIKACPSMVLSDYDVQESMTWIRPNWRRSLLLNGEALRGPSPN